jgi:hypothetical protein
MLGVGLSASCIMAFLGSSAQKMASCVGVPTPIVWALVVGSYVSCGMSSRESRTVEYYRKIVPQPFVFTETRTLYSFRVYDLSSCNLLSETTKFCLGAVLLSCLVLELHKTSSGLEPRTDFGVVAFFSIIFSSKQTILFLASFIYRAWYPSYRNHLHWESNPEQIFGVLVLVSAISSSKQTILFFSPFFYRA